MTQLTINQLAIITEANLVLGLSSDETVSGFSTDSCLVKPGLVFFVLKDPKFNQLQFVIEAQANGAVVAVVEQLYPVVDLPQLQVNDIVISLANVAKLWRQKRKVSMIFIIGKKCKFKIICLQR